MAQKVVISDTKSRQLVMNSVPPVSTLGPVVLNICIKDLNNEAECTLSKFTGYTKLKGVAYAPDGCAAIQRDVDRWEK